MAPPPPQTPAPRRVAVNRQVRAGVLIALVLLLGVWFWRYAVRDNLAPENFGIVEAGQIYRSADLTPAATRRVHDEYHIRTIVDLGAFDHRPEKGRVAQRTADALGIQRFVFPLSGDGTGNPNAYVAALRIMTDPARQPVLVHCAAGAQRTSACIVFYRNIIQGVPVDRAYPDSFSFRHDPARNPRLLPYIQEWDERIAAAYRTGTPIPGFEPVPAAGAPPDHP